MRLWKPDGIAKVFSSAAALIMALGAIGLRCDFVAPAGERILSGLWAEREADVDERPAWLYPEDG